MTGMFLTRTSSSSEARRGSEQESKRSAGGTQNWEQTMKRCFSHATVLCFVALLFTSLYAHGQFSGAEILQNCQQAERVLDSPQGVPSIPNMQQAGRCFGFM